MCTRGTMTGWVVLALVASACLAPTAEPGASADGGAGDAGSVALATLEVSPATLTLPLGGTAPVRVLSVQPDGTVVDVTATAELRSEPEGIVSVSEGQVRGVAAGSVLLTARASQLEARASVTVLPAQVRSIEVSMTESSFLKGAVIDAAALATLTDETRLDVTATAQWVVDPPRGATDVLRLIAPGRFLAVEPGEARVRATVAAISGSADLTVRDSRFLSLTVTPGAAMVAVSGAVQLSAKASAADGSEVDVTRAATWTSSAPTFAVDAQGLALAKSPGAATVTATFEGLEGSATLSATEATARQLAFMPGSLTLGVRTTAAFRLIATFSDGSTSDVTSLATFSSSAPAIASVSSSGVRGVVSGLSAGAASITARFATLSASAPVVVTAAAMQSLELTPRSLTLAGNAVVSVRARATYADGSQADVTEQALWGSDDASIAAASNVAGAKGQVRGLGGGATRIHAVVGSARAQADVTVQAATLQTLEVAPGAVSVEAGRTTQLRAMAFFSDGAVRDVTAQATWSSLAPMVASVSPRGLVRGLVSGPASIQATFQGRTATGTVRVEQPTLVQLSVSPGVLSVPLGLPAGFEATAAYSDGSTLPVTDQVQWTSSNPAVAEVLLSQGYAYLDSKQAGTIVITASMMGVAPARVSVTVTTATLTRLDVSPARPVLPVGAYVELDASGIYSDLTTQYLRYAASWTSSDPAVATVGNGYQDKGFVTALRAGTTTITATFGGVSSSTVLTVTSATLTQLQVTPFAPRLPIGFDTSLRATGLYSDNSTRDLTYLVSWTSSAPAVATVGSWASLQPIQAGSATITATLGGVQGTTVVTVSSATLTGLTLSMASMAPLAVQETRKLSARGSFSDGSELDVTPYVTWLSSAATVAAVSNAWPSNGEVKGLSSGSTTVSAVRGSISAAVTIQVQ
ncbi:MAG: Ig-like domain-containing protein [Myxococcaceae bacterium]|nr:Ig-like domain-containing protein [Myxococcaceae bacterium]